MGYVLPSDLNYVSALVESNQIWKDKAASDEAKEVYTERDVSFFFLGLAQIVKASDNYFIDMG